MTDVAIVILNWNGEKYLKEFLPSVISNCPHFAKVFIADNGSEDNSIEFLNTHYPGIKIIKLLENYGYTGGYNRALAQIDARYFILLNSDIEVTAGWIEPMYNLMEMDSRIAACQPTIRSLHEKEKFEYAGAAGGFIDWLGYPFCRGRIFDHLETDNQQYCDVMEIFWATGACLMVRANDFFNAGCLDESFFAHMEEIDLCWRLKNMGKKIIVCPNSKVFHLGGGTLPKNNPGKTYLNFRNNLLLLVKNLPAKTLIKTLSIRLLLDLMAATRFLVSASAKDAWAVFRAYFFVWKNFRKYFRSKESKPNTVTPSGIYNKSIVFEYYLKRKKTFSQLDIRKFTGWKEQ